MRTLGNILWHIPFLGFLSALFHLLIGGLFLITVVGAPIGLGIIQYSKFLLTPFSSAMISEDDLGTEQNQLWKSFSIIVWIFYIPIGLFLCFISLFQIVGLFVTIIGIPAAVVVAKSLGTYFKPINKKCVSVEVRDELKRRKAQDYLNKKG